MLTTATTQKQNVVMLSNNAGDQIAPAAEAAAAAGTKVVTWDSPIPNGAGEAFFVAQVDFGSIGTVMADMAFDLAGGAGEFAVLSASPDAANQNAWIDAMKKVLAEDAKYVQHLRHPKVAKASAQIAGKFKVHRIEISSQMSLRDIVTQQLELFLEKNGVSYSFPPADKVVNNKAAFEWGRRCAHDLAAVQALFQAAQVIQFVKKPSLAEMVAKRVEFLTGYQNAAYASEYQAFVEKVKAAEAKLGTSTKLSEAVARYLFKLMAYKDEYEVARLHTDKAFTDKIANMFEGDYKLVHHLAPPLTAKKNAKGELVKQPFGPWMRSAFGVLAKMKGLRGTALDIFGKTEERRMERALIAEYRACIDELLSRLSADNLALAVEIARIPEEIRGYGHVKERHLKAARPKWDGLMAQWRAGAPVQRQVA